MRPGYANRKGGCHLSGFSYSVERSKTYPDWDGYVLDRTWTGEGKIVGFQNLMGVVDALKMCKFPSRTRSMTRLGIGVTAWDRTKGSL